MAIYFLTSAEQKAKRKCDSAKEVHKTIRRGLVCVSKRIAVA